MKRNKLNIPFGWLQSMLLVLLTLSSCETQDDFEYKKSNSTGELGVSAWEYIQSSEYFTLLEEAINITELQSYYSGETAKTFIIPTNTAFEEYLESNSYTSLDEVPVPILRNALMYHIVNAEVIFTDPELFSSNKPIAYETGNGQTMYLSHNSNFVGYVNEGTSKQWDISTSNLESTNGIIHIVNSVVYFSAPIGDLSVPDPTIERDTAFVLYDTYVNGGSQSGTNFGTNAKILMKNASGDGGLYQRRPFLMFDLRDLNKEGVITDLELQLSISFTHGKGVGLYVYETDTNWTEMGLNWNNAPFPTGEAISSITSVKLAAGEYFAFNLTDYYQSLDGKKRISLMLDADEESNETDEFGSKENGTLAMPMLIATIATGVNSLELATNTGFTVEAEGSYAWNTEMLEATGAAAIDLIYTVEEIPTAGWLVKGASILSVGDRFTQNDIDVMSLLYINDGTGPSDKVVLTAKDRTGGSIDSFEVAISIQ
ncbi:CBM96 family carbohydrate-binding protein [Marinoscillum furvescens]|uniref:Cadherin-like protein n=1 Tax=Marinoscillum furvescens DSM 4134 TaxID=1122208 RepID=A0A3D9LHI3_MARFU|nr:DNRLRE domain-containing protein [Marinoscillum furvescens]REE05871.1 cadherin-like protein [Marinoscillum furvescens DSM 4134]